MSIWKFLCIFRNFPCSSEVFDVTYKRNSLQVVISTFYVKPQSTIFLEPSISPGLEPIRGSNLILKSWNGKIFCWRHCVGDRRICDRSLGSLFPTFSIGAWFLRKTGLWLSVFGSCDRMMTWCFDSSLSVIRHSHDAFQKLSHDTERAEQWVILQPGCEVHGWTLNSIHSLRPVMVQQSHHQ